MRKIGKQTLVLIESIARKGVQRSEKVGPPYCIGILHQPKRPSAK